MRKFSIFAVLLLMLIFAGCQYYNTNEELYSWKHLAVDWKIEIAVWSQIFQLVESGIDLMHNFQLDGKYPFADQYQIWDRYISRQELWTWISQSFLCVKKLWMNTWIPWKKIMIHGGESVPNFYPRGLKIQWWRLILGIAGRSGNSLEYFVDYFELLKDGEWKYLGGKFVVWSEYRWEEYSNSWESFGEHRDEGFLHLMEWVISDKTSQIVELF